ncbi:MAG: division/cell wall cluster transcriptional repressor MraZ [Christensenellales bacterium]
MVTRGTGNMLFIFSMPQWEVFSEKLMASSDGSESTGAAPSLAPAPAVRTDAQGRFVIPKQLRAYAKLKKDVVIAGAFTWGEIWDAEAWNEYEQQFADGAGDSFMELMQSATEAFSI